MVHARVLKAPILCLLTLLTPVGWLPCGAPRLLASPFTPHFDDLIGLLGVRSATLGEDSGKPARKLEKGLQKILKGLTEKASTSLATDIKNASKVARSLIKLFPGELTGAGNELTKTLAKAVAALRVDVETAIDGAQSVLDSVGDSTCKVKARASLDKGRALLAAVDADLASVNFAGATKSLKAALKAALKGDKAARSKKCTVPVGGNGNGNGDGNGNTGGNDPPEVLRAEISGSVEANFAALGALFTDATYDSFVDELSVYGTDSTNLLSLVIAVRGVTGPGTYPLHTSSSLSDLTRGTFYGIKVNGSVNFTVVDFKAPELAGTFEVTIEQLLPPGTGSITAKQGRFRVLNINGRAVTGG